MLLVVYCYLLVFLPSLSKPKKRKPKKKNKFFNGIGSCGISPLTMALQITDSDFATEVLESPVPVLVDFWAPWCGPCKMISPIVDQIAVELAGQAKVCKVNVDEESELASRFRIMTIPTLMVFKNGQVVSQSVGAKPKHAIEAMLQ